MTHLPAPNPWTRRAVIAAIMVTGVVAGLAMLLFMVWTFIEPEAAGTDPIPEERTYVLFILHVLAGLAGIALTPFALRHSPAERDPLSTASGPRSALVCGSLVIVLGMISALVAPLAVVVLVSLCSRRSAVWPMTAVAAYLVGAFAAELLGVDGVPGISWGYLAVSLVIPVVALLIGIVRRRRREDRHRVLAQARLAEAETAAREDRARIAERTRIARDMHDSLSHRLSLIAMHAGALEYRAETDPQDVRESAATIRESAHAAASDLRAVLSVLREGQEGTAPRLDLEELAAEARAAGTAVSIEWADPLTPADYATAPTIIAHTMYRIVQEGLTNARKHAPGAPVRVTLTPARRAVVLRMSNPVPAVPAEVIPEGRPAVSEASAGASQDKRRAAPAASAGASGRGVLPGPAGTGGAAGEVHTEGPSGTAERLVHTGTPGWSGPVDSPGCEALPESSATASTSERESASSATLPEPAVVAGPAGGPELTTGPEPTVGPRTTAGSETSGRSTEIAGSGLGLVGLDERVRLVGGTLEVHDPRTGTGRDTGDGTEAGASHRTELGPRDSTESGGSDRTATDEYTITAVLPWETGDRRP